jgi:hypothetical protein
MYDSLDEDLYRFSYYRIVYYFIFHVCKWYRISVLAWEI